MTTPQPRSFAPPTLAAPLAALVERFHHPRYLSSDPLGIVLRFDRPLEMEMVGLVAALLAYGNVVQIRRSLEDWIERMNQRFGGVEEGIALLNQANGVCSGAEALEGWGHRLHKGTELLLLLRLIERSQREFGSVGALFVRELDPAAADFGEALNALIARWKKWAVEMDPRVARTRSFGHLLSAPRDGSPCKRWCMFLRWMGRKDGLDPGLWTEGGALVSTFPPGRALRPRQLVLPLDTHTGRISQYLGLTRRKSLNWKAALEATRALGELDPVDPVRFDWALCRLGILDQCRKKYVAEVCSRCELFWGCRLAARGRAADARRNVRKSRKETRSG